MKKGWEMACGRGGSQPISRVLSGTVIYLGAALPMRSSNLPGNSASRAIVPLFGLAPGGVWRAAACCHRRGGLLPHLFTIAGPLLGLGSLFSVPLSIASRRPVVNRHPALRSPDFPLPARGRAGSDCLASFRRLV